MLQPGLPCVSVTVLTSDGAAGRQVHLVCRVPAYWDQALAVPRAVSVMVRSGDKESDPAPFTFLPAASSCGLPCAGECGH